MLALQGSEPLVLRFSGFESGGLEFQDGELCRIGERFKGFWVHMPGWHPDSIHPTFGSILGPWFLEASLYAYTKELDTIPDQIKETRLLYGIPDHMNSRVGYKHAHKLRQ